MKSVKFLPPASTKTAYRLSTFLKVYEKKSAYIKHQEERLSEFQWKVQQNPLEGNWRLRHTVTHQAVASD